MEYRKIGNLGIFTITLKQGKMNTIGGTWCGASHVINSNNMHNTSFNDLELLYIDLENIISFHDDENLFVPILEP